MSSKTIIIFGLICLAIGFTMGFIVFYNPPEIINQFQFGSNPSWDTAETTWDSL